MEERAGKKIQEKGATIRPKKPAVAPTPKPTPSKWKPSMTAEEAAEWSKNSTLQGRLYHGTEMDNLAGIKKSGFDLTQRRVGKIYGNGAYLTRNSQVGEIFAGEAGVVGEFAVNTKNTLEVFATDYWTLIGGRIDDVKYLTRGHEFIAKARHGLVGDILKKQNLKYKYGTLSEIKAARMKLYENQGGKNYFVKEKATDFIEKSFYKDSANNRLAGEWFDYIEEQYYLGNNNAIKIVESLADGTDLDDWPQMTEFSDLLADFMQNRGVDSLRVNDVLVPGAGSLTDNYLILYDPQTVTAIISG